MKNYLWVLLTLFYLTACGPIGPQIDLGDFFNKDITVSSITCEDENGEVVDLSCLPSDDSSYTNCWFNYVEISDDDIIVDRRPVVCPENLTGSEVDELTRHLCKQMQACH